MIKSVRIKLFLIFTVFLIFSSSIPFFLNVKYLEEYYVYRNERIFFSAYEQIREAYSNEPETIEDTMYNIERNENINSLILFEKSPVIKYNSSFRKTEEIKKVVIKKELADLILTKINEFNTDYIYEVIKLQTPDFREIVFIKELDTGEILILKKPLHVISTNSKIANEFLLFTGVITIILGSIFIFLFSKRITRPIIDLSHIAMSISNLDFSKKYKVKSKDEIGILGDSMNLISEELHKAMNELMEANSKLKKDIERRKEIDEMRKKFISSISHELKSPIGITKGYAEGLKYNIANNEEKRNRYCDILIYEANKMDKMVKQLLNLSNLESEVFKLEKSIFSISTLIDGVISKYAPVFKEKGIEVKFIIDEDYFVEADYLRIEQVISNYLTNGINHVDEGKYIEVRTQLEGEKVRVSVINSGENIPEEELKNIWKNFYKVDKARSRECGGVGLGLSIVKSIMEHHEEEYGVINREFGVEFWFKLNIISEK